MRRIPQTLAILSLAVLIASPLSAADEKKKKPGKQRDQIQQLLAKVDLSEEQQTKVAEIKKKYGEKLVEARKAVASLMTAEQRKARNEAMKQAKADGKTGKEAREAVNAAGLNCGRKQAKGNKNPGEKKKAAAAA